MAYFGRAVYGDGSIYGEPSRGYAIFLTKDRPPNIDTDAPVSVVGPTDEIAEIATAGLGLAANATYFGAVSAFTEEGYSSPAEFLLTTAGDGTPTLIPTPVRNLRAMPLSGGRVRLDWDYWEDFAVASWADSFEIAGSELEASGIAVSFSELVAAIPHQRRYTRIVVSGIPDGSLAEFHVIARKGLAGQSMLSGVRVRIDASPPAAVEAAMTAV